MRLKYFHVFICQLYIFYGKASKYFAHFIIELFVFFTFVL